MLKRLYWNLVYSYRKILSMISPTLATKYFYKKNVGKSLNLSNPKDFKEKLQWLKLNTYYNNPLITQCADKVEVRKYIAKKGLSDILNEVIGIYSSFDEIDWEELPNKFALKGNHGCGYNLICDDKGKLDKNIVKHQVEGWMHEKYWLRYAEVNYKFIKPQIIIEKYLDTDQGFLPYDYKFYCFNGKPECVLVMVGREQEMHAAFMDMKYNVISLNEKYSIKDFQIPEKPKCFDKMVEIAGILSKDFPFVRVDLYDNDGKVVFGELTFTPAGGYRTSETTINKNGYQITMGELLYLPSMTNRDK